MKHVLFVTSEAVPFVKTGGLADVAGSLPKYFDKKSYDVRIILPKYACIQGEWRQNLMFVDSIYVKLGWRKQYVGILSAIYEGITYYFIDNEFYFGGNRPYGNIHEDIEKFAFFSKAVLEAIKMLDFQPDILHCHDWQTGLIPVFLKNFYEDDEFYQNMKTIYTIHNLKFQGRWKIEGVMDAAGLPRDLFTPDKLEAYGEANYLKGGVVYSDIVTTVSRTYAKEITTPQGGEGLEGLFQEKGDVLFGIVNGLDYDEYDPAKDRRIRENYDKMSFLQGKPANKRCLQEWMGLPREEDTFLIGLVARLTSQKGMDLLACVLDEFLMREHVQIAILGEGEEQYENMFRHFTWKYREKISAKLQYSEELAHQIYAGADAFLMPSQFEPCGLSQLISMRYGTVPIVRETGGLRDTVCPYNEYEQTGNGFSFANYNAHEMLDAICYAKNIYEDHRDAWNGIVYRGMECDYSWTKSALEYADLYSR
ncbi:MAG: glycogen synthase GlgA [Lachnospiraceae bacterium]|nr:glycogen synthase GlgA [Lachnospiraceae bacterium]